MKRIKVHKAYFITWLFILYVLYANSELLGTFFMATVVFSTAIVGFLAVGTLYQFVSGFDIMMLGGTFGALAYKRTGYEFYIRSINSILPANIAHMLETRKNQQEMLFTEEESRNIIEWLENKFNKQKSYINFFINTSMLIGLLGTFVGLVESIDKMGQIILSLNGDVDIKAIMQQFAAPLSGMAIGFGASLFGVVTAVILGLNGYILFRYQDTLISGIEEWLKDRIIDMAPVSGGGNDIGSSSDLVGHRKTFMDVFLEQMSVLTQEMHGFSKANENFTRMSHSLSSIEAAMLEQKNFFKAILEIQEKNIDQTASFSSSVIEFQNSIGKTLEENKITLEGSNVRLETLSNNILTTNDKLQDSENILKTMLSLDEKVLNESQKMHTESIQSMSDINEAIHSQTNEIENVHTKIEMGNKDIIQNQLDMLHAFEQLSISMEEESGTLIKVQREISKINNEESAKLLMAIVQVQASLEDNKSSIDDIINIQKNGYTQENNFQLKTAQYFDEGIKFSNQLNEQLVNIEATIASYLEMMKSTNEQNKQFSQKQRDDILDVTTKLNNATMSLQANTGSLKSLENMVSKIESKSSHSKDHRKEKKSFFSYFFDRK